MSTAEGLHPNSYSSGKSYDPEAYLGPEEMYTPEYVGRLFFDSYRFSQGSPELQARIFHYLSENYGEKLSPGLIEEGVILATPRITRLVTGGTLHENTASIDLINETISSELNSWQVIFNDRLKSQRLDPFDLLSGILARDAEYEERGGRRALNEDPAHTSRSNSPHISHFIFYGLMGKDTGSPEYNAMFALLVDYLPDIPDSISKTSTTSPNPFVQTLPLFSTHFEAHPGDVSLLTPQGLTALQNRFEALELENMGIPTKA